VEEFKTNLVSKLPATLNQTKDYVELKKWIVDQYDASKLKAGTAKTPTLKIIPRVASSSKRYGNFRDPSVNQRFDRPLLSFVLGN
jgi:hypothetical protein